MISGCLLVLLLCQTVTAWLGGAFSMFTLNSGPVETPACLWDMDRVPEATPLGSEGICLDNLPKYDQWRINEALEKDINARNFLNTVTRLYQPMNQTYFRREVSYGQNWFDYEDMCPINPTLVHRVNVPINETSVTVCNVVNPHVQNIYRAECGKNCHMNGETAINHFCVPDGYIERYALVFCPSKLTQCIPAKIKIPVGCSCKKYKCLKYAK